MVARLAAAVGCVRGNTSLAWIDPVGRTHFLVPGGSHPYWAFVHLNGRKPVFGDRKDAMNAADQLLEEGWIRVVNSRTFHALGRNVSSKTWDAAIALTMQCVWANRARGEWNPEKGKVHLDVPNSKVMSIADFVRHYGGQKAEDQLFSRIRTARLAMAVRLARGLTLEHWNLQGLVEGRIVLLYHGTTKTFSRFDMNKSRGDLVNKFYGKGIFLSPRKAVAGQYADANRNIGFDPSLVGELKRSNPGAGAFLEALVQKGHQKAWEDLETDLDLQNPDDWSAWEATLRGVDPNRLSDLAPYILGSKDKPERGGSGLIFDQSTGAPDWLYNSLDAVGLDSNQYRPKVYTVSVKVENTLVTDKASEAKKARSSGYDCVVYHGSNLVGGVPEVAVFDANKIKILKVEQW